jgi:glutamine---fructose-6-phosphate transaminase (isomerizing)
VLYLGRGINYPIALEGALKLKEISYIHAEGYAAGELKHGPIALIDETVPVIVIAPRDDLFDKTMSNMEEVAARGGRIVLITDEKGAPATALGPWRPSRCPKRTRSSAPSFTPCRSSFWPTMPRCSWAPTSISPVTWRSRSR